MESFKLEKQKGKSFRLLKESKPLTGLALVLVVGLLTHNLIIALIAGGILWLIDSLKRTKQDSAKAKLAPIPVKNAVPPTDKSLGVVPSIEKRYCSSCGVVTETNQKFCTHCGNKLI